MYCHYSRLVVCAIWDILELFRYLRYICAFGAIFVYLRYLDYFDPSLIS